MDKLTFIVWIAASAGGNLHSAVGKSLGISACSQNMPIATPFPSFVWPAEERGNPPMRAEGCNRRAFRPSAAMHNWPEPQFTARQSFGSAPCKLHP